jgi:hypothetical protein
MVKQFAAETLEVFIPDPNDDDVLDAWIFGKFHAVFVKLNNNDYE